ncbi:MAG: T9SS type A sorting domain-containing protein [Chitinophagaceae bacterium]|nr:T9SS type A sorting domain-containing protein [Chitinophagaceae bacterium]
MLKFIMILLLLICAQLCNAQIPPITWQKTYGTTGNEVLHSITPTADGNYLVMGIADVNGSEVSCNLKGQHDVWVFKMTPGGNILWQQCFGGSKEEANPYNKIISTSDGGSLLVSESWSKDFDATGHHKLSDVLTIKLDASGNIQWKHSFGGKNWDVPRSILELPGKRYVIVSRSTSGDGDVPANIDPLKFDAWVFILNKNGNIISNHIYGGTGDDDLHKVLLAPDGNLVLFGFTNSTDGNLAGLNVEGTDAWLLKIDTLGNVINSKVYGQANGEEFYDAIKMNNGYMVFGTTEDPLMAVDKGNYHGDDDIWAVKLDNSLNMQWQGVYGGTERETMMQAVPAPGNSGFYLAGGTYSDDGDVVKPAANGNDEYVLKIGSDGTLLWMFTHGGTEKDYANAITSNGLVVGVAYSTDGDVLDSDGNGDGWIYKFKDTNMGIATQKDGQINSSSNDEMVAVYPNPVSDRLTLRFQETDPALSIELSDVTGRIVYQLTEIDLRENLSIEIPTGKLEAGIYILKITGEDLMQTSEIMVSH